MRKSLTVSALGLLLGLTSWISASAQNATTAPAANGGLEEVVVTAERQVEDVQKTPINIQVVSGETIQEQGLQNMEDILSGLPGITVQGQVRGFDPSIRGLGTDLPPGSAQGQVATEIDGVYDIRAEAGRVGFYDLDHVETLAGPQGTLYGVNADGGVVNIISNNPVLGKYQAAGGLTLGNYNLVQANAMLNLPVTDNSSIRFAAASINRDGYLTNTGADDNIASGGRIKYLWQPGDNFSLLAGIEIAKLGGVGSGSVNSYTNGNCQNPVVNNVQYSSCWTDQSDGSGSSDVNQWDRYHSTKYWTALKWNLQGFTVAFTPSYKSDYDIQNSCGMGPACNIQGDPIKLEQNSEELRFASLPGTALQWAAGFYHWGYLEEEAGMGPGNPPPVTYYQTSNGVFAQLTYSVNEQTRLIAGARETHDWKMETDVDYAATTTPKPGDWSHFDYRAGIEYDLTPQAMAYATIATGYRPGGNNPDQTSYQTEQVRDLEAGIKSRFWDNRMQVNGDVYWYNIQNYQLLDFFFPSCAPGTPPPDTYNLGARMYGADLSVQALLTDHDKVNASVSYMDDNFTSSQLISYNGPTSCDASTLTAQYPFGNPEVSSYLVSASPLPRAPKFAGNLSYTHTFSLPSGATIDATPSVYLTDAYFVNPVENAYGNQPGYGTENFSLTYKAADGKWSLALWGRNLSDEAVKNSLNPMILAAPRTWGATISAHLN
jgi:iron complex outermembrane recepter protein